MTNESNIVLIIAPLCKSGGYIEFGLSVISSVRSFVRPFVHHNFVSAQYLENKLIDFHQILYMNLYWHDLVLDGYTSFLHICTRVMAFDLRQNFVSAQYLENKLTDFHQILYGHLY